MNASEIVEQLLDHEPLQPGKYWLSPDSVLERTQDHEDFAWELLGQDGIERADQDDVQTDWVYMQLHQRGWVRVVVMTDQILMSGRGLKPGQIGTMRQHALEMNLPLLFDYGRRQGVIFDPRASG